MPIFLYLSLFIFLQLTFRPGELFRLSIPLSGNPDPEFSLFHDGAEHKSTSEVRVKVKYKDGNAVFQIDSPVKEDAGNWEVKINVLRFFFQFYYITVKSRFYVFLG